MPDALDPSTGSIEPSCPPRGKKKPTRRLVGAGRPFNSEVSLHVLNALDECSVLRTVFVPHRLDRGLERLLVGNVVHNCPGFDHLLERFLFAIIPELALLL